MSPTPTPFSFTSIVFLAFLLIFPKFPLSVLFSPLLVFFHYPLFPSLLYLNPLPSLFRLISLSYQTFHALPFFLHPLSPPIFPLLNSPSRISPSLFALPFHFTSSIYFSFFHYLFILSLFFSLFSSPLSSSLA